MELLADILGNIGVVCFLLAYFLLQKEVVKHNQMSYLLLNLAGSLLLLFSLSINWNLPAFILEACWAIISMYGIVKYKNSTLPANLLVMEPPQNTSCIKTYTRVFRFPSLRAFLAKRIFKIHKPVTEQKKKNKNGK